MTEHVKPEWIATRNGWERFVLESGVVVKRNSWRRENACSRGYSWWCWFKMYYAFGACNNLAAFWHTWRSDGYVASASPLSLPLPISPSFFFVVRGSNRISRNFWAHTGIHSSDTTAKLSGERKKDSISFLQPFSRALTRHTRLRHFVVRHLCRFLTMMEDSGDDGLLFGVPKPHSATSFLPHSAYCCWRTGDGQLLAYSFL